jgi:hypothetical protein
MGEKRGALLWWAVGGWLAIGLALALLAKPLYEALWILLVGVWAVFALLGLVLVIVALIRLPRRTALACTTLVIVGGIGLYYSHGAIADWGAGHYTAWRYARERPRYDAVVADVLAGTAGVLPTHGWAEGRGIDYAVDSGPPLRVAFLQPGGILDNWEGVVYDPTGRVATATGWRHGTPGQYTAEPDVLRVFGGDLVLCRWIEAHYYRCWFT